MQGSIQPRRVLEGTGNVELFPNLLLAGPKPLYKAERKDVILQPKVSNIAIIDPADCADTLLYKVRRGLMDGGKPSFSHQVHSDYVKTPSNPNEEKLNTQLCNSVKSKIEIIPGIVDRSATLASELHASRERQKGKLVVLVKQEHLEKVYAGVSSDDKYFPPNIRKKLRYILGSANFIARPLLDNESESLMVVGAHIRFPTTKARYYEPSIAVVVASDDDPAVFYLGSVRIQHAFRQFKQTDAAQPAVRRIVQTQILELKSMMVERFRAWIASVTAKTYKDPNEARREKERLQIPSSLILYRDAINFDDEVHTKECTEINAAYKEVFGTDKQLRLTCIIVDKNGRHYDRNHASAPPADFTTDTNTEAMKYRYYVDQIGCGLDAKALRDTVSCPVLTY
jgi:hypothetical protein